MKQRFVEIRSCEQGGYYTQPVDNPLILADLFDGADVGQKYTLRLVEMTQAEYDALPEFDGF
jgi:hypothetical protein